MQSDRTKASRSEPRFEERDSLVQAVFGGREVVAETASNVEVVVKRRRTLHADDGATIDGFKDATERARLASEMAQTFDESQAHFPA